MRFDQVEAVVIPDQIGVPQLVLIGRAWDGTLWSKTGDQPWRRISDEHDA